MSTQDSLPQVRYLTKDDPYHYSLENRPLEDLAARDNALAAAIDQVKGYRERYILTGNISAQQTTVDLTSFRGEAFTLSLTHWVTQDVAQTSGQITTFKSDILSGYVDLVSGVVIQDITNKYFQQIGSGPALVINYSVLGDTLRVAYSGYSGSSGQASLEVEKYGVGL